MHRRSRCSTYSGTIRGCTSILVVVPYFVKVVLVELAHEARKIAVFEVFRKDVFRKFLILEGKST